MAIDHKTTNKINIERLRRFNDGLTEGHLLSTVAMRLINRREHHLINFFFSLYKNNKPKYIELAKKITQKYAMKKE